jgi:hypothetical protein
MLPWDLSWQSAKHGSSDLTNNINELMDSLSHNAIYVIKPGHCSDEEDTLLR